MWQRMAAVVLFGLGRTITMDTADEQVHIGQGVH